MDGTDLARRMGPALRGRQPRQDWEALRRGQRPPEPGNAAECLKAARAPERRFDPLRRPSGRRG
ncbi:hypothetical protein [Falsiroseomonas sp. HW251]|uniref:hypothetical protein n=1 Tax=Falsiroseomonas sp. HW251 TaxID=3390998 RepID=UPI003D313325